MLRWVEIENCRSIKRLQIELQQFMVLVGPNGAGKTNIVQALELFSRILQERSLEPIEDFGGYDLLVRRSRRGVSPAISFKACWQGPRSLLFDDPASSTEKGQQNIPFDPEIRIEMQISIGATDMGGVQALRESLTVSLANEPDKLPVQITRAEGRWEITPGTEEYLWRMLLYPLIGIAEPGTLSAAELTEALADSHTTKFGYTDSTLELAGSFPLGMFVRNLGQYFRASVLHLNSPAIRRDSTSESLRRDELNSEGEGLPMALRKLRGMEKTPSTRFKRMLSFLQELYPQIEDVRTLKIQPGRQILSFKEKGIREELGQQSISDGILHVLAVLVSIEQTRGSGRILAIEEPENALHPWVVQRLIGYAQDEVESEEGALPGLMFTTHSPIVVDAVRNPRALLIVERTDRDGTIVTPSPAKEAALESILRESGLKLGDVWLNGSLGGVPGSVP